MRVLPRTVLKTNKSIAPGMRRTMIKKQIEKNAEPVTLKAVAEYVGLAAGTVSSILNQAPQSRAIPQQTRDRVLAAARKLRYQPNPYPPPFQTKPVFSPLAPPTPSP